MPAVHKADQHGAAARLTRRAAGREREGCRGGGVLLCPARGAGGRRRRAPPPALGSRCQPAMPRPARWAPAAGGARQARESQPHCPSACPTPPAPSRPAGRRGRSGGSSYAPHRPRRGWSRPATACAAACAARRRRRQSAGRRRRPTSTAAQRRMHAWAATRWLAHRRRAMQRWRVRKRAVCYAYAARAAPHAARRTAAAWLPPRAVCLPTP